MKKLKLNIMAIIGMMVAIGTVAFTIPNPEGEATVATVFQYLGEEETAAEFRDINNWQVSSPSVSCLGSGSICEVAIEETSVTTPQQLVDLLDGMDLNDVEPYIEDRIHSEKD